MKYKTSPNESVQACEAQNIVTSQSVNSEATPYGRYFYWQYNIIVNKNKLSTILTEYLSSSAALRSFLPIAAVEKL